MHESHLSRTYLHIKMMKILSMSAKAFLNLSDQVFDSTLSMIRSMKLMMNTN